MVVLIDHVVVNFHYSFFLVVLNSQLARLIGKTNKLLAFRERRRLKAALRAKRILFIAPKGPFGF